MVLPLSVKIKLKLPTLFVNKFTQVGIDFGLYRYLLAIFVQHTPQKQISTKRQTIIIILTVCLDILRLAIFHPYRSCWLALINGVGIFVYGRRRPRRWYLTRWLPTTHILSRARPTVIARTQNYSAAELL